MYRHPLIRVEIDRWDWDTGTKRDTVDLTSLGLVKSYNWQKTLKSADSSAVVVVVPQSNDFNVLDDIFPLDVVSIYEFATLKWRGFVKRISFSGYIQDDGKPIRYANLMCQSVGSLLSERSLGLGLGNVSGKSDAASTFLNAAKKLLKDLAEAVKGGITYAALIEKLLGSWFTLMDSVGAGAAATHIKSYLDYKTALSGGSTPLVPRSLQLFTGVEQEITLWQILAPLVEAPFNEMWFDVGPRTVVLDSGPLQLTSEKVFLCLRRTPFDGTVTNGTAAVGTFSGLTKNQIPRGYLTRFDLNKSMDEVYSVYNVVPSAFAFNESVRYLLGQIATDEKAVQKYMLKMLNYQPYYMRTADWEASTGAAVAAKVDSYADDLAQTFKNWYKNNDQFLSGAITHHVPDDRITKPDTDTGKVFKDPRIGEAVGLHDIVGSLYIEGVAHSWSADGPLTSTLSVTRGYDYDADKPISLSQRAFRLGLIARATKGRGS